MCSTCLTPRRGLRAGSRRRILRSTVRYYSPFVATVYTALSIAGCGSSGSHARSTNPDGGPGSGGSKGAGGAKGSSGSDAGAKGPACTPASDSETNCSDGADDDCDGFIDCLDSDCEGKACGDSVTCLAGACLGKGALPELPRIESLVPTIRGDTAIIDFAAVMGAADYRIYPLPAPDDILVGPNGEVAVRNAVYRCGGALPREDRRTDGINRFDVSLAGNVQGYTRTESEALLGYVFLSPGTGRVPIYRVANPNSIGGYTWEYDAPPAKEFNGADYVQGTDERDALLAKGWRDDGIAFYISSDGTRSVYRREYASNGFVVFYIDGPEKTARDAQTDASEAGERFKILASAADGAVPLSRVLYSYNNDHDILAAGDVNRDRVLYQGNIPITSLSWPGLKGSTTLVLEALDKGCPFPGGYVGAMAAPAAVLGGINSQPTITLDQARLTSGEVYVNGQYDTTNHPNPIARAYVTVAPAAQPDMDWFESFDSDADLTTLQKLVDDNIGTRVFRNDKISLEYDDSDANYSYGAMLGQFVAGSSASFYVAALGANATIQKDTYVHGTMRADMASTNRRYPQMWITDTPLGDPAKELTYKVPFSERLGPRPFEMLPPGPYHTIVAQTFGGSPELQIQFCDLRGWGVSEQCPKANIYGYPAGEANATSKDPWLPLPVVGDYIGMDRLVKFDVYASTDRVYLFVEDKPAGCAVLPAGRMPAGPVTVIFGVAAYHIEVDEFVAPDNSREQYWKRYSLAHTDRKLDDLGVKTGVSLPAWDESIMPCGTQYNAGLL